MKWLVHQFGLQLLDNRVCVMHPLVVVLQDRSVAERALASAMSRDRVAQDASVLPSVVGDALYHRVTIRLVALRAGRHYARFKSAIVAKVRLRLEFLSCLHQGPVPPPVAIRDLLISHGGRA